MRRLLTASFGLALLLCYESCVAQGARYIRVGNAADVVTPTTGGFALMGGGTDLDEAFRWMCARSGGGDFLILRAAGSDAYNPYVQGLCRQNSVATLIVPSREAAMEPKTSERIAKAAAIFLAGGDQARYVNFWMGTPMQKAINDAVRRGVPMGGTSAGLAVLGEYIYSAQNDLEDGPELSSVRALADPFDPQIVVARGFVQSPLLSATICDTHFVKRDRMGRLLAMMARIAAAQAMPDVRGIGIDERTAVLVDAEGRAVVVGAGAAYFLRAKEQAVRLERGMPLEFGPVAAVKLQAGGRFDLHSWKGTSTPYIYGVQDGVVRSSVSDSLY